MRSWPAPELPRLAVGGPPGARPALQLHDTATAKLRQAAGEGVARMYVCGITPYDATHLGHAATYLAFDLANRVWRDAGLDVDYVQNVTDIDDPLLERAAETCRDWRELADTEIELFRQDMTALRVLPPREYVGAVEAIPLIMEMIEQLRARGATYDLDGDIYFPVAVDSHFGEVSGYGPAEMRELFAERGGDPDRRGKKDPLDALLWQAARPGEPSWESPFGPGRPGWHLECAAISIQHLGMGIDVAGGGSDLIFPHHEMGASHAAIATGQRPYARTYAHSGMVGYDGEKMSKSRGNLVLVSRLRAEGTDPMAIRLALLAHHYRSDWEWTDGDLERASARLHAWRSAVRLPGGPPAGALLAEVRQCLAEDLDAPAALAAVDQWADGARAGDATDPEAPAITAELVDALLGVAL